MLYALFALALLPSVTQDSPDYQRDVRPILVEHCFQCHGQDEKGRQAGLRLDLRETAIKKLDSGSTAIMPNQPAASELLKRVASRDPDTVMPPPSTKKTLNATQMQTLERWISGGAPYANHWSFTSLAPVAVPKSAASHPIDAIVRAKLDRERLAPSPRAAPEVLCRRLYLDLIGLPPSPKELDAFVVAAQKDWDAAVRELADRLLNRQSQQYAEKWTRHWLDVARYADSNGYEKDLPREQWAWRDWVIDAFNCDLPYDQFITQQIAGDLLAAEVKGDTRVAAQERQRLRIATGFLRNGMINEEGAIVPEEFRMEGMFDRLDCLGKAVFGLSLQCAQCHSHKFDPITQAEYYGMFGFLNNTYEAQSWVYDAQQLDTIDTVRRGLAEIDARLKKSNPDWAARLAAWEADELTKHDSLDWQVIDATDMHSTSELNHPTKLSDGSILTLGHRTVSGDHYLIAEPNLAGATALRLEILRHGDLPFGGPGRSYKGTWAITELFVDAQKPGETKWERQKLVQASADFSEPEHQLEPEWQRKTNDKEDKRTCGPVSFMIDGSDETGWRADRGAGRRNADSVAVMQFEKPLDVPPGTKLKISLRTNHGGDDNGAKNVMVGRFRVSLTSKPDARISSTPYSALIAMRTPHDQRSPADRDTIFSAWRASVPEFKAENAAAEVIWKQYPEAKTSVLHLAERSPEHFRATYALDRGVWNRPKDLIAPHVPAALHALSAPSGRAPNRLDFAKWLVQRQSPLAARVAVNRVWQAMFGVGLVETAEDFGTRAPTPEYAELLDWLANDFMENGWSHKQLIRTIVSSATYQQTSSVTPALLERDPRNRLLARGPRFRVEAEVLRDIALSTAGLLHPTIGGPSFFPPVPQSVLDYNYFKPSYWSAASPPERYRRSLYVFRKRSMPDPVLTSFDAPNADFACARRPRSNTPLSALVSLNEQVFVEAARALALRILNEGGDSDESRIDYAYRLCVSRVAKPAERTAALKLLKEQRQRLADGWLSVREITTGNASQLPKLPANCTPQDAAAWTLAARVFLNLDETMTKN